MVYHYSNFSYRLYYNTSTINYGDFTPRNTHHKVILKTMENTILLIDGSSFIFRAFYAVKSLNAPNGMPTNAIYGVVNMFKQMQKKYTTPYWVCVFDAKGKTFRDEIYPQYKANRSATPEDLVTQFPYIHKLVTDLGIPVIIQDGVEADDVIATIAKEYAARNFNVIVATGDKDFGQIVNENVTLVNTMNNELLDVAGVENKFGVKPAQIIDYLSLIGDTADNVPGVHKCGPKTAQKWLQEYGSIHNLIIHKDELSGVVGENFRQALEWLPIAQKLITIDDNVTINDVNIYELGNLKKQEENLVDLVAIYRELNFKTWLKEAENNLAAKQVVVNNGHAVGFDLFNHQEELEQTPIDQSRLMNKKTHNLQSLEKIEQIISNIIGKNTTSAFGIIREDSSQKKSPIAMITIATSNDVYLINLNSTDNQELFFGSDNESKDKIILLTRYLESNCPKISYNIKQHLYCLNEYNIKLQGVIGDLVLASYLQNPAQNHKIAAILARYNIELNADEETVLGKGAKRILFSNLSQEQQNSFAENLISCQLEAHQEILATLDNEQRYLYTQVELPLTYLLYQLEQNGMLIDIAHLHVLAQEMHTQLNKIAESIYLEAKTPFNINSPKQLQEVLFNQLNLPTTGIKKNTSGFSTDEESLSILADSGYGIANLLLEYRYLSKLLNTYIDKLPSCADQDGFVHTSLEQTVVMSGRLSSKDPNLQNIPVRSHYGQLIRECFIAKPNHKLICADYSQIELRILAHISNDENLINAFKSNVDVHIATASQIFAKPITEVTKDERRYAKSINFGLIYGKSVFGLAKELKIERAAAKLYIDSYFAQYPKVRDYMENIKHIAHTQEYVTTIHGRKIFLPNINSKNNILRQAEERLALNAPMQGSAADIIKLAMLNVEQWLRQNNLATKMVLQVHDELIFQVPDHEVELILSNLERLMSENFELKVPLLVEAKAALNWGEAH